MKSKSAFSRQGAVNLVTPGRVVRVAHVTTVDISLRYMILNLMKELQKAGYEVSGICSPGPNVEAVKASGIQYFPVRMTRNFTPARDLLSLFSLYRVMRRNRFSIVHTHTPKAGLLGQLAARMAGTPIVVNTIHGFYFHDGTPLVKRRFYALLEKIAAGCSTAILSQNREDVRTAIRERICRADKIDFLGNGVDATVFDPARVDPAVVSRKRQELGIDPFCPVVGFVGRMVREKGIVELFRAIQLVRQSAPDVRLLVVGPVDRDKPDALSPETAGEYGVADCCVFTGRRDDMPELYSMMDVLVLPSHREGFPRPPMEASFLGIPSVVTDVRGCREAVEHEVNGLVVPLGDVAALAGAIVRVLRNREEAARFAAAGKRIACERFDERLVAARVLDLYGRLLSSKTAKAGAEDFVNGALQDSPRA